MRKIALGLAVLLVIGVGAYMRVHHAKPPLEVAYAGNHQVTLWSTTAQVREPIAVADFGDRLEVLQRFQDQVNVRTVHGIVGWINERDLLSADIWQRAKDTEAKAAAMPVEAHGRTKVLANLRLEPGRDAPRLRQLNKAVAVDLLLREPVPVLVAHSPGAEEDNAVEPPQARKEDWWLVRAHAADQGALSGWLLGRFVELDVPAPLPDYASSAGMRIVGWFELNRVTDPSGAVHVQYLVVGAHGPEGQPCDFTLQRVYTWGVKRQRYETAFVESNICGKLPVKLAHQQPAKSGSEITYQFTDIGKGSPEDRKYRMYQTVVRRVREGAAPPAPRKKPHH
jgi:hypothetical protein